MTQPPALETAVRFVETAPRTALCEGIVKEHNAPGWSLVWVHAITPLGGPRRVFGTPRRRIVADDLLSEA